MKILQYIIIAIGILALAGCAKENGANKNDKTLSCKNYPYQCHYSTGKHRFCSSGTSMQHAVNALVKECGNAFGASDSRCEQAKLAKTCKQA